jgi:hypothetical protein
MPKIISMIERRFDLLLVASRAPSDGVRPRWNCTCDCGNTITVAGHRLRNGHTKSCGCKDGNTKPALIHGKRRTQEYAIWAGMLQRCKNPNRKCFAAYGGSGISVCIRWRDGENGIHPFVCFLADVGERPTRKHSLEREDATKNYEPGNVRWALPLEQANNKRRTRWVVYRGQEMSLCDAVRAAGSVIHYEAAAIRLKCGWTVERALETPSSKKTQQRNRADRALAGN